MQSSLRRWFSVPALVLLGAGLVQGGADLPRGWAVVVLGVPFMMTLLHLWRPTKQRWRLAFGSFCLLILTTLVVDLSGAIPERVPALPASVLMVALFVIQFGVPAWLLWLADPGTRRPTIGDEPPNTGARPETESEMQSGVGNQHGDMPPNHRAHPTTRAPHGQAWLLARLLPCWWSSLQ